MSDISLLMTGIFTKGQQPPEPPPTILESEVQSLAPLSLSSSLDKKTISAPEFLQTNNKTPLLPLLIQPEIKSLLNKLWVILRTRNLADSSLLKEFRDSFRQTPEVWEQASSIYGQDTQTNIQGIQNSHHRILTDPSKTQRLRNQLVTDGSLILAKYGNTREQDLPVLRFGNTGISVRVLQRLLASNGYAVRIDGEFGALTEAAVKAFQSQREIVTDGIVGRMTWMELTQ